MRPLLFLTFLLLPLASAQNNTTADAMDHTDGMDNMDAMDGNATSDPEGGSNTLVWIVVVAALIVLVYAYGRMKPPADAIDEEE